MFEALFLLFSNEGDDRDGSPRASGDAVRGSRGDRGKGSVPCRDGPMFSTGSGKDLVCDEISPLVFLFFLGFRARSLVGWVS